MRLYNPTPDRIIGKYAGVGYQMEAGQTITVTEETGKWILERWDVYGLVDITLPVPQPKNFNLQNLIVRQTLQGLDAYLQNLNHVLEQFMEFDTELKQVNFQGTILTHKECKKVMNKVEEIIRLIKEIETKYGVSIAKENYEEKSTKLMASIESLVAIAEADEEGKKAAKKQEADINKAIKELIPKEVGAHA